MLAAKEQKTNPSPGEARPHLLAFERKPSTSEGLLSVVDLQRDLPFQVKRSFWVYEIDHVVKRGHHANRHSEEVVFCLAGSIQVRLVDIDGNESHFELNERNEGLYIPKLTWLELVLAPNSVMLVFASQDFRHEDYLFDFSEFRRLGRPPAAPVADVLPLVAPPPQLSPPDEALRALGALAEYWMRPLLETLQRWRSAVPSSRLTAGFLLALVVGFCARMYGGLAAGDVADVSQFHAMANILLAGKSPYLDFKSNYLPGLFPIWYLAAYLSQALDIPFSTVLRGFILCADLGTWLGLTLIIRRNHGARRAYWAAITYLLSPILVIIVGCHGQFDTVAFGLALLAIEVARAKGSPLVLGFATAAAIGCKPQNAVLLPLLALSPQLSFRYRAIALFTAGAVIVNSLVPYAMRDGISSMYYVLFYRGYPDQGVGGLLRAAWLYFHHNMYLPGVFGDTLCASTRVTALAMMSFLAFATRRVALEERVGAVLFAFLVFHAGLSTQYLCWPVIWLLVSRAPLRWTWAYGTLAALGAIGFYIYYFPAIIPFAYQGPHRELCYLLGQCLCYPAIVVTAIRYWRLIVPAEILKSRLLRAHAVICAVALIPTVKQISWLVVEGVRLYASYHH